MWWPRVEGFIARACERGDTRLTPGEIHRGLSQSLDTMLVVLMVGGPLGECVGCFVVEVMPEDRLHVAIVAGRDLPRRWLPLVVEHLEDICRVLQLREITGGGRRGWARVLRPYGWRWEDRRAMFVRPIELEVMI